MKPILSERTILGQSIPEFLSEERKNISFGEWSLEFGENFLYDRNGLNLIATALKTYNGTACEITFTLNVDNVTARDYYRHSPIAPGVKAVRRTGVGNQTLRIDLPVKFNFVPYPTSLTKPDNGSIPQALLMDVTDDFDLLFANQIMLLITLSRNIKKSLKAKFRGLFNRAYKSWELKVATSYKSIHPSAEVHPTAVVEGSIIEKGARIGAHAVVRFSHVGKNVRIHDGAKVELSYVGENSWLMHDLVLYRSYTEDNVFLIHGPYQFSGFQKGSGAFGTIMMDYRPDQKPIRKNYHGRFLGSILKPGAKTLGGSLIAPGQIINENCWLTSELNQIHNIKEPALPEFKILPPSMTKPKEPYIPESST